jgi:WD40 repeat protein
MIHRNLAPLRFTVLAAIASIAGVALAAKPSPATAQAGVIAFRDDCGGLLYAMRADGSGRIAIPLPTPALPTDRYRSPLVLDVSTAGPLTVVYYVGIDRLMVIDGQNVRTIVDYGLFAVQLNDVGGVLTPDPPVRLSLPEVAGVDPNRAQQGSFSPTGSGDRFALVAASATSKVLMTAQVERDVTSRVVGLTNLVVVGDLESIGLPDPGFPDSNGFTGGIDYAPDGNGIVASIYFDLWRIHLGADNTFLSAEWLTPNTDGYAEWNPSFSPDSSRIAYSSGRISSSGGAQDPDIYSLDPASHAVLRVTNARNKGKASGARNNAMWSSDSAWIGFSAYVGSPPRRSPCSGLLNSEIFQIRADGSTTAAQITNTNGTGVEAWPGWGW